MDGSHDYRCQLFIMGASTDQVWRLPVKSRKWCQNTRVRKLCGPILKEKKFAWTTTDTSEEDNILELLKVIRRSQFQLFCLSTVQIKETVVTISLPEILCQEALVQGQRSLSLDDFTHTVEVAFIIPAQNNNWLGTSRVVEPWYFGMDPDPRIRTTDSRIRIRILFRILLFP